MGSPGQYLTGELDQIFSAEEKYRSKDEILNTDTPIYHLKRGGGYISMAELEDARKTSKNASKMSAEDEESTLRLFSHILGLKYFHAKKIVEDKGYSLHPIYTNDEPKNPAPAYNRTILGVRIKDPNDDYSTLRETMLSMGKISEAYERLISDEAIIEGIVDIGGQDTSNRGQTI